MPPAPALRSVTVFCGSAAGHRPEHVAAIAELGRELAARGLRVVYGGARVGTMGALAEAVLDAGGHITGVIPRGMVEREVANRDLTELHVVGSMHERKALMADLADGFIAAPGGLGTLEEWAEIVTWAQLGDHDKPVVLLNTLGYYDPLLAFVDHALAEGFVRPQHRPIVRAAPDPVAAIAALG
jgi:uncharacterized protein (TIGR00730 family)